MESRCFSGSSKQLHKANSVAKQLEVDNKPKLSSKGASFIKVLSRDFSKQLQIPHEFTMTFNGYIPHRFIIESSVAKKCYRVEVEDEGDGTIYFREGWAEFVEAHTLEVGDFLLFEYEEQSIFQVKIYGRNGCQKSELVGIQGGKHNPVEINDFEEEGQSEYIKCEQQSSRKRGRKIMKILSSKKNGNRIHKKQRVVRRTYKRACRVSISRNNACFSIKMNKFKKHQFTQLTVPKSVSLEKKLAIKDEVRLQDALGNCWLVKLAHRSDGRGLLAQGWKDFLKDNGVAGGDTIDFEFISDDVLQVRVIKTSQVEQQFDEPKYQNGATRSLNIDCKLENPGTSTDNDKAVEASINAKRDSSELCSSFSFLWRKATTGAYLHIPKAIVEDQRLMNKESVVLRDPEGKCWPLEVRAWNNGNFAFTKGWREFWKGHGIKVGDTLDFKFVSDFLVQVDIERRKSREAPIEEDVLNLAPASNEGDTTQPDIADMIQAEAVTTMFEPVFLS